MIFRPEMVEKIYAGKKTETRRPVAGGKPCRYRPGRSYAIQPGRGRLAVGRLAVLDVRRDALGNIDEAGARREGFESRGAFLDYWFGMHGFMSLSAEVWVIRFRLEGESE
jgi:hypothetical protein